MENSLGRGRGWGVTQKQGIHKETVVLVQAKDPVASAGGMVVKRYIATGSVFTSF